MSTFRKIALALTLLVAAFALVIPAFAQDNTPTTPAEGGSTSRTITIMQDQITQRVSQIDSKRFSDVSMTLGDNQLTVAFTLTPLHTPTDASNVAANPSTAETTPSVSAAAQTQYAVEAVLTPDLQDGRVQWTLASLTVDGQPATDAQLNRFSTFVKNFANRLHIQRANRRFQVTAINITPDAITVTVARII